MLDWFPFSYRAAFLLGLMAVVAGIDYWRKKSEATKHREYGFIWIGGVLGGLVGFANDCVTSTISPDYFIVGKGLEPGDDLRWRAGLYGCQEGLSAGIIGGAICLVAQTWKSRFSKEKMSRLLRTLWMPVAGAVLLGIGLPLVAGGFDPLKLSTTLSPLLDADHIARFKKVWWIHTGLYAGMAVGLAGMILRRQPNQGPTGVRQNSSDC